MKNLLNIQLQNISHKGWTFHFDSQSKELNKHLKDLIGENDYSINVSIQPEGDSTYKIKGSIKTHLDLLCSRCAYEFKHPVNKDFSEKIIVQKKQQRIEKKVRINHYSEQADQKDFTVLTSNHFKLSDFIHELIAIEEPIRPLPKTQCDQNDNCENLKQLKTHTDPSHNLVLEDKLKPFLKTNPPTEV